VTNHEIRRYFSDVVAVGLPTAPFATLVKLRKVFGKRVHLFAPTRWLAPHLLTLAIPHRFATERWNGILVMQLLHFAEQRGDRVLTLVPCTPDAIRFVNVYRETLESAYTIKNTDMQ